MYSKKEVAEGNLLGTAHLSPTPHLKLGGVTFRHPFTHPPHLLNQRGWYLNPGSKSYCTSSPTPHLEVGVYSKKEVAEGNLLGTPHLNPTPQLKLECLNSITLRQYYPQAPPQAIHVITLIKGGGT